MVDTAVKEIELGNAPDMASYNKARDEGKSVIEVPAEKPVEEVETKPAEETDADHAADDKGDDKPKVKGGFQRKIDRLTKAAAEAQERADKAEARARELEAKG